MSRTVSANRSRTARPSATTRAFVAGSMRGGSSTSSAASPAGTIRRSAHHLLRPRAPRAPSEASDGCRRSRRSTSRRSDRRCAPLSRPCGRCRRPRGCNAHPLWRALQIGDEHLGRQPLAFGQGRAEDGRQDDAIGLRQRPREVRLEDPPARRRGSRLEDRPDAAVRVGRAHAFERFTDRGRMVRKVVVDRDTGGGAAVLQPPADAPELRGALPPSCRCSVRRPRRPRWPRARCGRCRRRAAAART